MIFDFMKRKLGDMPESDRMHLKRIEENNNCRFTLEDLDDFVKDLDFFKDNQEHLLLIQNGLCVPFSNIHPDKVFYGVVRDAAGYKTLTGKEMSTFFCPREGVRLVPIWAYKPDSEAAAV